MEERLVRISKFLSLVLRHRPDEIGIALDEQGWVDVDDLLEASARHRRAITRQDLVDVVRDNDKKRFALSEDGKQIRASQGHSVDVALGYQPAEPPPVLYHGTATGFLARIEAEGLRKMNRHHVHLSADAETARRVGGRHGKPVVLRVDAIRMHREGRPFFRSANGVWLTEAVPWTYLSVLESETQGSGPVPDTNERLDLATVAQETLAITRAGGYTAPGGRAVDISARLKASVAGTLLHRPQDVLNSVLPKSRGRISVTPETTASAGSRFPEGVILNFAAGRRVGGGFLRGARAQEESLCRCSGLYDCLAQESVRGYYEANARTDALYTDHILYSPDVVFFRDDRLRLLEVPYTVSVITAPAPNAGEYLGRSGASHDLLHETLARRARRLLEVAQHHGHRQIVLGAWGCGAFKNDPDEVASIFAQLLPSFAFDEVVFAIFDSSRERRIFSAFERVLLG